MIWGDVLCVSITPESDPTGRTRTQHAPVHFKIKAAVPITSTRCRCDWSEWENKFSVYSWSFQVLIDRCQHLFAHIRISWLECVSTDRQVQVRFRCPSWSSWCNILREFHVNIFRIKTAWRWKRTNRLDVIENNSSSPSSVIYTFIYIYTFKL